MPDDFLLLLAVLAILLVFSGIASGAETALFGLTHGQRIAIRRTRPALWNKLSSLLARPRLLLITVLLINMTVNVIYFVVSSILTMRADGVVWSIAVSIGSVLAIVLLGEVLAKLIADKHRDIALPIIAAPMVLMQRAVGPLLIMLDRFAVAPLVRLSGAKSGPEPMRPGELDALLQHAKQSGDIDSEEQRLLSEVIELGSIRVREVMLPRVDVAWIDSSLGRDALIARCRELLLSTKHHRFPLADDSLDKPIKGILDARSLLTAHALRKPHDIDDHLTPALFVPEHARLDQLLERFRDQGISEAICVDERGALVGIVEVEDIVDELLRAGAHQPSQPASSSTSKTQEHIHLIALNTWLAPGRMPVRDFAEAFGADPDQLASRVSTIAGLLAAELGRVPIEGDSIKLDHIRLTAHTVDGRSVVAMQIELLIPPNQGAPHE